LPAAAAFVALRSLPVASALKLALRLAHLSGKQERRVGRRPVLQKAQKLGVGAFVLLMGASLLAMRPHPASKTSNEPQVTAAHLKLANVSTASRQDVDYRLLDARLRQLITKPAMVGLAVGVVENGRITFLQGYGETLHGSGEPVTPETVFRWASC
jgi:beta-lactamase class C